MKKILMASAALLALLPAHAAINIGSTAFSYAESFDSLTTSGTAVTWTNDSTLPGWSLFNATGAAIAAYAADDGASNAGTYRSYGSASSAERALGATASGGAYFGSPASGTVAGWMAVAFSNGTGAALAGFTLGFAGEQWRNGGNTSTQPMVFEYGIGASFASVSSWTAPGGNFDWNSPVTGATAAAVLGNSAGLVANRGGSVNTAWAAGDTLWLRWVERNDIGNDHGLAIDNVSLTVSAVPEPATFALILTGIVAVGFLARRRA